MVGGAFTVPFSHTLHLLLLLKQTVGFGGVIPLLADWRIIVIGKVLSYFRVLGSFAIQFIHHAVHFQAAQIEH